VDYGDPKKRRKAVEALDDIDHRLASSIDVTAKAVARIEKLFANSIWCATTDQAILQASSRALEKKAPSHNGKSNFADAVIIELCGQMVANGKGARVRDAQHEGLQRAERGPATASSRYRAPFLAH